MVFPRPLLPPMMTTFLPRKRCALLNSFMAQSFHKDTIQFGIFSGYPVDRSDLVHAMNVLAKRQMGSRWVASEKSEKIIYLVLCKRYSRAANKRLSKTGMSRALTE